MVHHKNITIERQFENEEAVKLACAVRTEWSSGDVQVKRFTDGITNRLLGCFLATNVDDVILIRVYGEMTELFIDREKEQHNMKLMNEAGLAPELYFSFNNGLCYGYTPGLPATYELVNDPIISKLIAFQMARMHSVIGKLPSASKRNTNEASLFRNLAKYIELIPSALNSSKLLPVACKLPTLNQLQDEVTFLRNIIDHIESPIVFCHNDLLLKNIIYYERPIQGVTFIDFEYADFNYQAYDIANHFCEFAGIDTYQPQLYPNEEFQLKWLTNYVTAHANINDESPSQHQSTMSQLQYQQQQQEQQSQEQLTLQQQQEQLQQQEQQHPHQQQPGDCKLNDEQISNKVCKLMKQVKYFTLHAHFFWAIWSLLQAAHSSINFDFVGYALDRLKEYEKAKCQLLSGPGNGHLVEEKDAQA